MKLRDIGEVAAETGLPVSTLRYYDEIGLISSVSRNGLRRQFPPETSLQLRLIALGKSAGFSLREMVRLFAPGAPPEIPREKLRVRAAEIDAQIAELTTLRDTLRHVADCPAPSHLECPSFRRLLDKATHPARPRRIRRRAAARA